MIGLLYAYINGMKPKSKNPYRRKRKGIPYKNDEQIKIEQMREESQWRS